nr:MAG TPA: hypothetical protein [Caudoviricetes sp.]
MIDSFILILSKTSIIYLNRFHYNIYSKAPHSIP